jgi:lipoprotein NlpD
VNQERFEKFIWPVRGKILKEFGTNGLQTCQGVEIATPGGTPILSASAGIVTYSGNGIRGYGNLIILKHEGSFYTVYAFNKKNLVQPGAKVGKGEKIALSGTHPVGGHNCLHFEIRRGKTAVNPILYLP